jgi:hypothetical protein
MKSGGNVIGLSERPGLVHAPRNMLRRQQTNSEPIGHPKSLYRSASSMLFRFMFLPSVPNPTENALHPIVAVKLSKLNSKSLFGIGMVIKHSCCAPLAAKLSQVSSKTDTSSRLAARAKMSDEGE